MSPIISGGSSGSSSGAGAMTLITDTLVGVGGAANVDFAAIAGTFKALRIYANARSDTAAATTTLLLRFNADSGANYDDERMAATTGTASGAEDLAATSINLGTIPAASATAGLSTGYVVDVYDYASTTFQKWLYSVGGAKDSVVTAHIANRICFGAWRSAAAVTEVTLTPGAGSFIQGTRVTLYGIT